ncbi:hypothetical protein BV378_33780 [Nostoc sp. RF31YmG]|nr:hypothetical protein BV378_33780 [Nostoc sp. RF31YmG]
MLDENQGAIELADEELDMVAGGFNFFFAATFFEQSDRVILQNTQSGPSGSSTSSLIATRDIRTFAIQGLFLGDTPSQFGQSS